MGYAIRLLGHWSLDRSDGPSVAVRRPVARLLAYLALQGGVQQRGLVAGNLWPDVCDHRASSNLRSTLWHARTEVAGVVAGDTSTVWLHRDITVDVDDAVIAARALLAGTPSSSARHLDALFEDLLPEWDEEWLCSPRFLHRQLRLQALDRAIACDLAEHRLPAALDLARRLARYEPLRESTHRLLATALVMAGDRHEARHVVADFERRSLALVGLAPSPRLAEVV